MNTFNRKGSLFYPMEGGINLQPIMRRVYIWMGLGTLLTAIAADVTVHTSLIRLSANLVVVLVAVITELGMVLGLNFGFNRFSLGVATALFFGYAVLNGFTLSLLLLAFRIGTVISAFAAIALLFGVMSVIGYTTRAGLTKMGTYLMMGVIGLVIAMVVSPFINSRPLNMLISMVGVLIFTGLTAYDTQRIARIASQVNAEGDAAAKVGIFGALRLYLDFINMFFFIPRLMGGGRRS